jgi:hypothetical protein
MRALCRRMDNGKWRMERWKMDSEKWKMEAVIAFIF